MYWFPHRPLAATLLWLLLSGSQLAAQQYTTETGYIEFVSRASIETFTGTSKHLTGMIDLSTGDIDFYVDLNTIRTGISLRDEHMRDTYLETDRFPFAEFVGKLNGFNPSVRDTQNVIVSGEFSIHGVTKQRTIQGRVVLGDTALSVEASWSVLLSEHDIAIPKIMFLKLADSQEVMIRATLKKKG